MAAVSNNRQMRQFRFELRHSVTHNDPAPDATEHFAVVHGVAKRHTILHRQAQMLAKYRQRSAFITTIRQHFQAVER